MTKRILRYLTAPKSLWYRVLRDFPYWITGRSYYTETQKKHPPVKHVKTTCPEALDIYLENKSKRRSTLVVYTCITDNYDDISEIATPTYINPDWDYVCFTDNRHDIENGQVGIWEIRPLIFTELDSTRNNRWHKLHPHILFPDYKKSIYIDGNIDILSPYLFRVIDEIGGPFILPRHNERTCIYDEYKIILSELIDDYKKITQEESLIRKSGMPKKFGLTENNILYRRHDSKMIVSLMEEWWNMIIRYSKRDQLSLMWLLWKRDINPDNITFPNSRTLTEDFCVFPHKRRFHK